MIKCFLLVFPFYLYAKPCEYRGTFDKEVECNYLYKNDNFTIFTKVFNGLVFMIVADWSIIIQLFKF
jgi:hypothetical protein